MAELLVAHFDGPRPYETDFQGDADGIIGQAADWTGGVIFRPGKFGKAVQIAQSTTNELLNPIFENNVTDGWDFAQGGTAGSRNHDTTWSYVGSASCRIVASDSGSAIVSSTPRVTLADGESVTIQVRIRRRRDVSALVQIFDATNTVIRAQQNASEVGTAEYIELSWTNDTGAAADVDMRVRNQESDGKSPIWADGCQMEKKSFATPLAVGSFDVVHPDGTSGEHAWTGTAHNSTSTRSNAHLTYDTPAHLQTEGAGAILMRFRATQIPATQKFLFDSRQAVGQSFLFISLFNGNVLRLRAGDSAFNSTGTIEAHTWYDVALAWDGTTIYVYIDGVLDTTQAQTGWFGAGATFVIGHAGTPGNALIDDLHLLRHFPSTAEIKAYSEDSHSLRVVGQRLGSVNLLNPGGLYLDNNGWQQQVAELDDFLQPADVAENLALTWAGETEDARAPTVQLLKKLGAQARRRRRERRLEDYVWLEARGISESEMRYALLQDVVPVELDGKRYGPQGPIDLALQLRRQGDWRSVSPISSVYPSPVVLDQEIGLWEQDEAHGIPHNYVTLAPEDVPGDLPALTILEVKGGNTSFGEFTQHHVAVQTAQNETRLDLFSPNFDARAEVNQGAFLETDFQAPDDRRLAITGSSDENLDWIIPADSMDVYRGQFHVYMIAEATADNLTQVQFQHSPDNEPPIQKGDFIAVNSSAGAAGVVNMYYLGRFTLPGGVLPSGESYGDYRLRLKLDKSGTVEFQFYSIRLVRIDAETNSPFVLRGHDHFGVKANGVYERSYNYDFSTEEAAYGQVETRGRYIRLKPGYWNRIYFFKSQEQENDVDLVPEETVKQPTTVRLVPRYSALRGDA